MRIAHPSNINKSVTLAGTRGMARFNDHFPWPFTAENACSFGGQFQCDVPFRSSDEVLLQFAFGMAGNDHGTARAKMRFRILIILGLLPWTRAAFRDGNTYKSASMPAKITVELDRTSKMTRIRCASFCKTEPACDTFRFTTSDVTCTRFKFNDTAAFYASDVGEPSVSLFGLPGKGEKEPRGLCKKTLKFVQL